MKVSEQLQAALDLFEGGKRWTQGASARDSRGVALNSTEADDTSSFCAVGAVCYVTRKPYVANITAMSLLDCAALGVSRRSIVDLNDENGQSFWRVAQAFRAAITLAKDIEDAALATVTTKT
jgi:hypothetical protein